MYKAYNVEISSQEFDDIINPNEIQVYRQEHERLYVQYGEVISGLFPSIEELYYTQNEVRGVPSIYDFYGHINTEKIKQILKPLKRFNIFVSHSHKDEDAAVKLAYITKTNMSAICFVDSIYWKNFNDLVDKRISELNSIKGIGDSDKTQLIKLLTTYGSVNLSIALNEMMDNCECLFFLNTPNSVKRIETPKESSISFSNWIYYEIFTTGKLQIRIPRRYMPNIYNKNVLNNYKTQVDEWIRIDIEVFKNWLLACNCNKICSEFSCYYHCRLYDNRICSKDGCLKRINPLDALYNIVD